MNKKFTLFLIILIVSILYISNADRLIQNKLAVLNKFIQSSYINIFVSINSTINKYLNQLDYINQLKKSNDLHLKYKLLYDIKISELDELNKISKKTVVNTINIQLNEVKVLSYYKFNDNSRVLIDTQDLNSSKIYSLMTHDGYSAGIVLNKNNTFLAYLNNNDKCNYTVFIGKENVPGITSGISKNGNLLIKYVPIWKKVSLGDEVITSSMDSIFPFGVKVGKVTKINIKDNIQEVLVLPYAKILGTRKYYLYNANKNISNN